MRRNAAPSIVMALSALVAGGCGAAREEAAVAGDLTLEQARAFDDFPLYAAGESVDGLPLAAIVRRDDTASYVSFIYGECEPAAYDQGCAPPAEIQVWPACRRSLALYAAESAGGQAEESTTVRGAPAVFLDDGTRLELETGGSTVVLFGSSRARVLRIARALRPFGSEATGGMLPPVTDEPCQMVDRRFTRAG